MSLPRQKNRIAVTGMGCCCGAGTTVPEMFRNLQEKKINCLPIPDYLFQTDLNFPAFIMENEVLSAAGHKLLDQSGQNFHREQLNRSVHLTIEAAAEALYDAGLSPADLRKKRVGIILGTTVGCTFHDEQYYIQWRQGKHPDPEPVFNYLNANLAAVLQAVLNVQGPTAVVTNACASGTDAIGIARDWLARDLCDIALAGGADALSRIAFYGFASLMLLSESPCAPFDENRSGLNLGEGAGVLVLEPQVRAEHRKAHAHGWVRGYGAASDCYHPTTPDPEGRGLQKALTLALSEAGIDNESISYINAHGTGTTANDKAEMAALAAIKLLDCPVMSTKGITGHMLGAAGAAEAILTMLTLAQQKTCGTIGCVQLDQKLARGALTENEHKSLKGKIGISQSLAFGGTNSALILEANGP